MNKIFLLGINNKTFFFLFSYFLGGLKNTIYCDYFMVRQVPGFTKSKLGIFKISLTQNHLLSINQSINKTFISTFTSHGGIILKAEACGGCARYKITEQNRKTALNRRINKKHITTVDNYTKV